ncbi:MAG: hypothetical protein ACRDJF_07930 [Actinomycetota bacterium]
MGERHLSFLAGMGFVGRAEPLIFVGESVSWSHKRAVGMGPSTLLNDKITILLILQFYLKDAILSNNLKSCK